MEYALRNCKVLFICSGNACRSIMAEAILRKLGAGHFSAYSAGCRPTGKVDPRALAVLERRGYPTAGLQSKPWTVYAGANAVEMDLVVTVCDMAAIEVQPPWPGQPVAVRWNFRAPGAVHGTDEEISQVFEDVCHQLELALKKLVLLPFKETRRADWDALVHCIPVKY